MLQLFALIFLKIRLKNGIWCYFSEIQMMAGIIPEQYQKGTFEKISRGSLNMVVQESEVIIEKVKKASENKDFLSIIYLFEVVKHFDKMKSRLQGISKQAFHP